nr:HNH endonuclease signature motif containing protein [uncultured Roseococcus sp.]
MARIPMMQPRIATLDTRTAQPAPKQRAAHYGTAEHEAWRAEVIRRAGGMCQGRGCGRSQVRLFADHIVELKDGGAPTDIRNGQALCGACHTRKTAAARAARQG